MKFCPSCGEQNLDTAKYCVICGKLIPKSQQPSQPQVPQQFQQQRPSPQAPQQFQQQPSPHVPQQFQQQQAAQYPPNHRQYSGPPEQNYQGGYVQQTPVPPKKRRIPLPLKILLGIVGFFVIVFVVASMITGNTANADYYTVGGEKIPSVKSVIGKRTVTSISTEIQNGATIQTIKYKTSSDQNWEMQDYAVHLFENEGFVDITPANFEKPTAKDIRFARVASESGYVIILQIDYDSTGYTLTITKEKGNLDSLIIADTTNEDIADADYYTVGGEKIPSVKSVIGKRTVIDVSTKFENDANIMTIEFQTPSSQNTEMLDYARYLMENEGFINITDIDFNEAAASGFQFSREVKDSEYIIILQIDYDNTGYTITISKLVGTLTYYD